MLVSLLWIVRICQFHCLQPPISNVLDSPLLANKPLKTTIKPLMLGHVDNINRFRRCENFHAQDPYKHLNLKTFIVLIMNISNNENHRQDKCYCSLRLVPVSRIYIKIFNPNCLTLPLPKKDWLNLQTFFAVFSRKSNSRIANVCLLVH